MGDVTGGAPLRPLGSVEHRLKGRAFRRLSCAASRAADARLAAARYAPGSPERVRAADLRTALVDCRAAHTMACPDVTPDDVAPSGILSQEGSQAVAHRRQLRLQVKPAGWWVRAHQPWPQPADPHGERVDDHDRLRAEVARLRAEVARLRAREAELVAALAEAERRVTLGGRAPQVDTSWANLALPAPPSAGDDTAPPLHRRTRDEA